MHEVNEANEVNEVNEVHGVRGVHVVHRMRGMRGVRGVHGMHGVRGVRGLHGVMREVVTYWREKCRESWIHGEHKLAHRGRISPCPRFCVESTSAESFVNVRMPKKEKKEKGKKKSVEDEVAAVEVEPLPWTCGECDYENEDEIEECEVSVFELACR